MTDDYQYLDDEVYWVTDLIALRSKHVWTSAVVTQAIWGLS